MPRHKLAVEPGLASQALAVFRHYDGSLTYITQDPTMSRPDAMTTIVADTVNCQIDEPDPILGRVRIELLATANEMQLDPQKFISDYLRKKYHVLAYLHRHEYRSGTWCWAYIQDVSWFAAMGADYAGSYTPERALADDLRLFAAWVNDEQYAYRHVNADGSDYQDVGGFIGYPDLRAVAEQASGAPVLEQVQ